MIERASALPPELFERVRSMSERVATQPYEWVLVESRRIAPIVSEVLFEVGGAIAPGATTRSLHDALVDGLWARGLGPAMLGFQGFPFGCAVAVNDELVGGEPSERVVALGDLVKLEVAAVSGWAFAGQSWTFVVGDEGHGAPPKSGPHKLLLRAGQRALRNAILRVRPAATVGDLGAIIQSTVEQAGLAVVRSHVGYAMGHKRIMAPQIPGWGEAGTLAPLVPGLILHLHVILKEGAPQPDVPPSDATPPDAVSAEEAPSQAEEVEPTQAEGAARSSWTVRSHDGARGALFSAMVEITADAREVLAILPDE